MNFYMKITSIRHDINAQASKSLNTHTHTTRLMHTIRDDYRQEISR